jgi:hypothetical protein
MFTMLLGIADLVVERFSHLDCRIPDFLAQQPCDDKFHDLTLAVRQRTEPRCPTVGDGFRSVAKLNSERYRRVALPLRLSDFQRWVARGGFHGWRIRRLGMHCVSSGLIFQRQICVRRL